MERSTIHLTSRMQRIMKNAEIEARNSKSDVLQPAHLLVACLKERTGVLGEIGLKCHIDVNEIRALVTERNNVGSSTNCSFFGVKATEEVVHVLDVAIAHMKRYNQNFLNEGHLLKALISTHVLDQFLSKEESEMMLTLGTAPRDMITPLSSYTFPKLNSQHTIRKAKKTDEKNLVRFVKSYFSEEWSQTVREAFLQSFPQIYIALDQSDQTILGFAGFDSYKNKKGYFGPMGVSDSSRVKGLGFALLHHCLRDMKDLGYEYAIIGEAGPLEFYPA